MDIQGCRQVCKSGGAGKLLSAYMQILYTTKIQCQVIITDTMFEYRVPMLTLPSPTLEGVRDANSQRGHCQRE